MAKETFSNRIIELEGSYFIMPQPRTKPTPGQYYQVRSKDYLYKITKQAYGSGKHSLSRVINDDPYNRRFWRKVPNEQHLFPDGRISFNKVFTSPAKQMQASSKVPRGRYYALIWIPPKP